MSSNDLFPSREFDDWAESYDRSVAIDQFPFYGYEAVLGKAVALAESRPGLRVLDLGTGTGNLAVRFSRLGCELWCTDFSDAMLAQARLKLPGAHFLLADLRNGWPAGLSQPFDRIVSAYVFHHFELDEKIRILQELVPRLSPDGRIVIADIAFPDRAALEKVKLAAGDEWEDEFYWLADEAGPALANAGLKAGHIQVSACAGVFTVQA